MNKYKIGQHITAEIPRAFHIVLRDGVIKGYLVTQSYGDLGDYTSDREVGVVYIIKDVTTGYDIDVEEEHITGVLDANKN